MQKQKELHRSDSVKLSVNGFSSAVPLLTQHKSLLLSGAKVKVISGKKAGSGGHCEISLICMQSAKYVQASMPLTPHPSFASQLPPSPQGEGLFQCFFHYNTLMRWCQCDFSIKCALIFSKVSSEMTCSMAQASCAAVSCSTPRAVSIRVST